MQTIPFVKYEDGSNNVISVNDSKKNQIKIEIVDFLGQPMKGLKDIQVVFVDSQKGTKDMTSKTKQTRDNSLLTVTASGDEKIGAYEVQVTANGFT